MNNTRGVGQTKKNRKILNVKCKTQSKRNTGPATQNNCPSQGLSLSLDRGVVHSCCKKAYKSTLIRCAKCQIFGIWHTKHQKLSLISSFKSQKIWDIATVPSQIWDGMDSHAKTLFGLFNLFFLSPPIRCLSLLF